MHRQITERIFGNCGYVYKCKRCSKHFGYSSELNRRISLSKKDYDEYIKLFTDYKVEE